ncbi:hypothetical protein QTP88_002248 [Uroleucon formosanum]
MPFGLSGAPSTFQRLMKTALTGINGTKAFVYLDDIIVYASDLKDHESKLRDVFSRLRKFNLRLQSSKCQFLQREVIYLGHLITDEGVNPDPGKIQCVQNHPVPRNTTEIKRFLGLSGYYRRFIEGYSQTAKPLTALLNKDVSFEWSTECPRAFETLKQKLVEAPVLQYLDFQRPFILTTDASQFTIGTESRHRPGISKEIRTPTEFKNSTPKENREDMYISLRNLQLFCQEFEIKNLAMPKIGCGLDQLD